MSAPAPTAIAAPTAVTATPTSVTAASTAVTAASMTGRDDMGDRRRLRRSGIGCSRRRRGDSYRGSPCRQYRCEVVQSDSHGRTPSIVQCGLIPELPSCERMSSPLAPIRASPLAESMAHNQPPTGHADDELYGSSVDVIAGVGELVRSTTGQWIARPPLRCPRGHPLRPGRMLVGSTAGIGHVIHIDALRLGPSPYSTVSASAARRFRFAAGDL